MSDQSGYEATLRAVANEAEEQGESDAAARLQKLADTADDMTPAERTWVAEASQEQLRSFAVALRSGCSPEEAR
jgi:hypothetical protein